MGIALRDNPYSLYIDSLYSDRIPLYLVACFFTKN